MALFEWTSGVFADGTRVWWSVRARSAEGIVEDNTVSVAGEADATGPPVHLSVESARTADTP